MCNPKWRSINIKLIVLITQVIKSGFFMVRINKKAKMVIKLLFLGRKEDYFNYLILFLSN